MDKRKLKWRIFAFLLGFCALLIAILWFFQTVLLTETYKMIRKAEIGEAIVLVEENIDSPDLQAVIETLATEKEIMVAPAREFSPPEPQEGQRGPGRPPMETVTETKDFTLADGETQTLSFYAIITPVDATVSTLRFQLYIISGVMLLCSIVLAIIIARRVSRPIEDIS
jgi:hypothetical protein